VKQACFSLWESSHVVADLLPLFNPIQSKAVQLFQGLGPLGRRVRITRLPGIHHDANAVIMVGSKSSIMVDTGTTWYQMLQLERLAGHLGSTKLERILLTSRRFPFCGAAGHISQVHGDIPIHIHPSAISAMDTGDFFTTWANRYDSDMPSTKCEPVVQGEVFEMGDGVITTLSLPGHTTDGMGYFEAARGILVAGSVLPRADSPSRWDMPGGCLPELIDSLKIIHDLSCENIVPARGPTIKGRDHIDEILNRHLEFFEDISDQNGKVPRSWPRPARTAYFLTPPEPWPLDEIEFSRKGK
jgi:glyoxylase-like metal-dependent hydrolase (beta-lactamase superfamily II)